MNCGVELGFISQITRHAKLHGLEYFPFFFLFFKYNHAQKLTQERRRQSEVGVAQFLLFYFIISRRDSAKPMLAQKCCHSSSWSSFTGGWNYSWMKPPWFVFQGPDAQMKKKNGLQLLSGAFLHSALLSLRGHGGPLRWLPRQLLGSVAHRLWEAESHWVRDFDYQLADPGNFHFQQFLPERVVFSGEIRRPFTTGVMLQRYVRGGTNPVPVSHLRGSLLGCGPSCDVCQVSRITEAVWPGLLLLGGLGYYWSL